jgi:hypothetical protein
MGKRIGGEEVGRWNEEGRKWEKMLLIVVGWEESIIF